MGLKGHIVHLKESAMRRLFHHSILPLVAIVLLFPGSSFSQSKADQIDALLKRYADYGQFNGSALVAQNGKVIFKSGYGMANKEWNIPNTTDTKFRLGSITKQFTSMLIMQLVQQGKLKLDGKITDYLPDYPKETGDRITIHQLLTHTSGIHDYTSYPAFFRTLSRTPSSPTEFIKLWADSALDFEPGTKWSYSNSGYFMLGVIIEKVTGKSYEQMLQKNIFDPLGLKGTGYDHSETIIPKRASGYERGPDGWINAPYLEMSLPYSAGSLYSTAEDLYKWDQALYTDKLLPPDLKEKLWQPYAKAYAQFWYGYGWVTGKIAEGKSTDSVSVIQHGGGINGFNTLICRFPGDKSLVVLLNNTGGARLSDMCQAIAGILYDKPYDQAKRSLAETLVGALRKGDISAAVKQYRDIRKNHMDEYALNEREMNVGGYQLLRGGHVEAAIEIFKLNVEEFPKSANTYDSLGEAYMMAGNKELAIKNYETSVKLDPTNTNGKKVLERLKGK